MPDDQPLVQNTKSAEPVLSSPKVSAPIAKQPEPIKFAMVDPEGRFSWDPKWNTHIVEAIDSYGSSLLEGDNEPAADSQLLCSGYSRATRNQKIAFWSLFFASFARYESGFDPAKRYHEDSHLNYVYSEGLLQLSYGDEKNHSNCPISKSLANVLQPKANLQCGVAIMVGQLKKCQCLFPSKAFYWSVLTNKKTQIMRDFKKAAVGLGFCN